ncbi:hypothetical protein ACWCQS_32290 [Streptomyces sp. NPDC002076]
MSLILPLRPLKPLGISAGRERGLVPTRLASSVTAEVAARDAGAASVALTFSWSMVCTLVVCVQAPAAVAAGEDLARL